MGLFSRVTRPRKASARRTMPACESLEGRQLLARVFWTSPVDGFWDDAANWDRGILPQPGDDVAFFPPTPGTTRVVTYRGLGADSVRNFGQGSVFSVQSGTFHLLGGTMLGGGELEVEQGGTLVLGGETDLRWQSQTLINRGTVQWVAGDIIFPLARNFFINEPTGVFDVQTDNDVVSLDEEVEPGIVGFENRGTLIKSAGTEETIMIPEDSTFTNTGRVELRTGTLTFEAPFAQTGLSTAQTFLNGGTLKFVQDGTFLAGSLTGQGTIQGNVINAQAAVRPGGDDIGTITIIGNFTQQSGTLVDPARLDIQVRGTTPGTDIDQLIVKARPDDEDPEVLVGGEVALAGALNFLVEGITPVKGQRYQFISESRKLTGRFEVTNFPPTGSISEFWHVEARNTDTAALIVDQLAEVALVSPPPRGPFAVGKVIAFATFVKNNGPNGAFGLKTSVKLPENYIFWKPNSSESVEYDAATNTVTGLPRFGNAFPGYMPPLAESFQLTFSFVPLAGAVGTEAEFNFQLTSDTPDPDHTNESATHKIELAGLADLVVDLNGPAEVAIGDLATYTLNVKNNGPNTANNVQVLHALPANTVFDAGASSPGLAMEAILNSVVGTIEALPAGESKTFTIVVRPTVAASGLTLTSQAFVGADEAVLNPATTTDTFSSRLLRAPEVRKVSRYGAAPGKSFIVITFDKPMDPISAQNRANYRIQLPGRDGKLGTADDARVPIKGAFYDSAKKQVTLSLGGRMGVNARFRVTVFAQAGVTDAKGVRLAGNGSGLPGIDYVGTFGRGSYRGPASHLLRATKARAKS